jgi:hypothetical protein
MTMPELNIDDALAGLLVPDEVLTVATIAPVGADPEDSSYTLGSPIPGRPVFRPLLTGASPTLGTRSPDLRPIATGNQGATTQGLVVTRAGMPGEGLDVVNMRHDDDGDPAYWGWSQPQVVETLSADTLNKGFDGQHNAAAVETADGYALFVWANITTISCRRYDPVTHTTGSSVNIADSTLDMTDDAAGPSIEPVVGVCRLRSGRLLAVGVGRLVEGDLDLCSYWSDDHGLTWRSASLGAADRAIATAYTPSGLAVGYDPVHDAVIVVMTVNYGEVNDQTTGWAQYASTDGGASFRLVEWWGDTTPAGPEPRHPIILSDPRAGGFVVACSRSSVADSLVVRRIGSPYTMLSEADVVELLALGTLSSVPEWVTGWADRQGVLWLAAPSTAGVRLLSSADGGASWLALTTPPYAAPAGALDRALATTARDVTVWAGADTDTTAWAPQQLLLWESGGWQQLCQPRVAGGYPPELRAWAVAWHPWSSPVPQGWTRTGTAGTIASVGVPRLDLPTATGSLYYIDTGAVLATGTTAHIEVSGITGTISAAEVILRVVVTTVEVEARFSGAHVRLYDVHAAAQIGSDHALPTGGGQRWHVRLAVQGAGRYVALYVRRHDQTTWALAASGTATAGSSATSRITFGHGAAAGTVSTASTWHRAAYSIGGYGVAGATNDAPAFGDVLATAWPSLPGALLPDPTGRLPLAEGLDVCAAGGPGLRGESWTIAPDDRHAVDHLLSRAVAEEWRSADDAVAQRIAWDAGLVHHPGGRHVGVAVFGANFRECTLQGWDGAAWVDVAALDLGLTGLSYTRSGDTIRVASGGTARGQLRALDLVGASIVLGSGVIRRIAGAVGGTWADGSATATLRLEGVTGAEPTSGTATLWHRQGAAVRFGHLTGYARWGLHLPAVSTVDGVHRLGRVVIGSYHAFGAKYSRGRVEVQEAQVATADLPGLTTARRLAPTRRRWRVAWVEGLPTRRHLTSPAHQAAGGQPLASLGDVSIIDALTDTHGGGQGQIVYLPRLKRTVGGASPETSRAPGRDLCALVTLRGAPSVENVEGDEVWREVVRIADVELEEEP